MNELHQIEKKLLIAFDKICRKHHLQYFLLGGSALGAIRHQGFIPWDDDIDIGMPRDDYDKFINLQKEFDEFGYFIQTYQSDPKYIYNYAKLRDSNTTFIEKPYRFFQINHGVWIDIFPLDGFSLKEDNPKQDRRDLKHSWRQAFLCYPWAMRRKFSLRTFPLDLLINIGALCCFWTNVNHYRNKRLDRRLKKIPYENATIVGNHYGIYLEKEAVPKEWFGKGKEVLFEGIKVYIPFEYDKFLRFLYGDYMILPPIEKRIPHHKDSGFSLTISYKDYLNKRKR